MTTFEQTVLDLSGPVPARFDTFIPGPNSAIVAVLKALSTETDEAPSEASSGLPWIYLSGPQGSGRTHLLFACCQAAREKGHTATYINLSRRPAHLSPNLQGIESSRLVALDDIDHIAGEYEWEEGLFHFLNRARSAATRIVMAGKQTALEAGFSLPDLRSRLNWGQRQWLKPLSDEELLAVLRLHAEKRDLPLDDKTARYLLNHGPRNCADQIELLNWLKQAAFAAKRKPSVHLAASILRRYQEEQMPTQAAKKSPTNSGEALD